MKETIKKKKRKKMETMQPLLDIVSGEEAIMERERMEEEKNKKGSLSSISHYIQPIVPVITTIDVGVKYTGILQMNLHTAEVCRCRMIYQPKNPTRMNETELADFIRNYILHDLGWLGLDTVLIEKSYQPKSGGGKYRWMSLKMIAMEFTLFGLFTNSTFLNPRTYKAKLGVQRRQKNADKLFSTIVAEEYCVPKVDFPLTDKRIHDLGDCFLMGLYYLLLLKELTKEDIEKILRNSKMIYEQEIIRNKKPTKAVIIENPTEYKIREKTEYFEEDT